MVIDRGCRCVRALLWAAVAAALMGGGCLCPWAEAATTTYSGTTGDLTIDPGDTAVLVNNADVNGNITNNGTLEFALTDNLTVSNLYSITGVGNVLLTASGTITFSGSNSYSNGTTVRYGELVITSGGSIDHAAANMTIGSLAGDIGTLRVTGGRVTDYSGILGDADGSIGTAFVTSGTWTNIGDLTVGSSGTGAVTISGGRVVVQGSTELGYLPNGTGVLTVSGGTLDVATTLAVGPSGEGTLLISGGSVFSGDASIALIAGSSGTATITSGTWSNAGSLSVGFGGVGALEIAGGTVIVGDTLSRDVSQGTIHLDSGATLQIGTGGASGVLDTSLTNNGTLIFDRSDFSFYGYGYEIDGTGVVIKKGAGVLQFTGSNSYSGGTTILGGAIDVTYGGAIYQPSAALTIGNSSGAIGELLVTGGVVNTSLLDVSNGDVNLTNGLVESGTARIGAFGSGTATIAGGVFGTVNSLFVGYSGTGTMDVNGGNVLSMEAILGTLSGDYGEVSVSNGSVWGNFGNLTVGGAGTGVLNISSSGEVLVTGTLSRGTYGTINLDAGGTLRIGNGGITGTLATDLTNDGTLFFNRSNAYTYGGQIDGTGAFTKLGSGALTFSGTSSYTGATTIESGAFYVTGRLGQTAVTVNDGAFFGGDGTVLGGVTIGNLSGSGSAVLSPGSVSDPIAILSVGSLSLTAGSLTQLSVSGTVAGVDYDQVAGIGSSRAITYGGDLEITLSGSSAYADGTTFHLFTNFTNPQGDFNSITLTAVDFYASIAGAFTKLDATTWVTNWTSGSQRLQFSTITGDLIVVPEPTTMTLAAFGLALGGALRWRGRRRRAAAVKSASGTPVQA